LVSFMFVHLLSARRITDLQLRTGSIMKIGVVTSDTIVPTYGRELKTRDTRHAVQC